MPATASARSRAPSRCPTSTPRCRARSSRSTTRLADSPQLLNDDPYGDGWICVIEMSDPAQLDGLLDAAAYRRWSTADHVAYVFCNQCGHRNPPESSFCSSCGSPLDVARRPHDHAHRRRPAAGRPRTERRRRRARRRAPSRRRGAHRAVAAPRPATGSSSTPTSPASAAIPTARSGSTTSRSRAATPTIERTDDGLRRHRRRVAQRHLRQPGARRRGA